MLCEELIRHIIIAFFPHWFYPLTLCAIISVFCDNPVMSLPVLPVVNIYGAHIRLEPFFGIKCSS